MSLEFYVLINTFLKYNLNLKFILYSLYTVQYVNMITVNFMSSVYSVL